MKLSLERKGLIIEPDTILDIVFIEEVLGLKKDGDKIELVRINSVIDSEEILHIRTKES